MVEEAMVLIPVIMAHLAAMVVTGEEVAMLQEVMVVTEEMVARVLMQSRDRMAAAEAMLVMAV